MSYRNSLIKNIIALSVFLSGSIFAQQYNFRNYTIEDGLPQSQIYSLYQDSRGYIWAGTIGGGVCYFDGREFKMPEGNNIISGYSVLAIGEDGAGRMLFGVNGEGLFIYDGSDLKHYRIDEKINQLNVFSIYKDSNNKVWLGTNIGTFLFDGHNFSQGKLNAELRNTNGLATFMDRKGNLWFSMRDGVLKNENGKWEKIELGDKLSDAQVSGIIEDLDGNMWLTTYYSGLLKLDENNKFHHYSKNNYLTTNRISGVRKDHLGNLWFYTFDRGIIKYNGETFLNLTTENGLINNLTYAMTVDSSNNIWIGTEGGLSEFFDETFVHYPVSISKGGIFSIVEDKENNIWFSLFGSGLARFSTSEIKFLNQSDGLLNNFLRSIYIDSSQQMWISTLEGVQIFKNGEFRTMNSINSTMNNTRVDLVFEDSENNFWLGTYDNGIYKYSNGKTTHPDILKLPNQQRVKDIKEDSEGNIWFATHNGILIYNGQESRSFSIKEGIPHLIIIDMLPDYKNNMWIGTYGGGLARCSYDFKSNVMKVDTINSEDGLSNNNILSLVIDDENNLWAGTNNGVSEFNLDEYYKTGTADIITYQREEGFTSVECNSRSVLKDHNGNIWFGTIKGLTKYRPDYAGKHVSKPRVQLTDILLFNSKVDWNEYTDSLSSWYNLPLNLRLKYNKNHLTFEYTGINLGNPFDLKYRFFLEGFDKHWSPPIKDDKAVYSNLPAGSYIFKVIAGNNNTGWTEEPVTYSFVITSPLWERWWFYTLSVVIIGGVILGGHRFRVQRLERQRKRLEEIVEQRTKELRESQAKIIELEKAATERQMAGGFAHEMRNALAGAKLVISQALGMDLPEPYTSMNLENSRKLKEIYLILKEKLEERDLKEILAIIKEIFPNEERLEEILKLVYRSTDRGLAITNQILEYSRLGDYSIGEDKVNIVNLIEETIQEINEECKQRGIIIESKIINDGVELKGEESHYHSVLKNILLNAKDALIEKGETEDEKKIEIIAKSEDGAYLIEVKDNGIGIREDDIDKIFDAFFSTKPETGTGLGLGMVKKIVNIYGGTLKVESKINVGTSFFISFPIDL